MKKISIVFICTFCICLSISSQNVGVGTTVPTAKLEVQGDVFGKLRHMTYHSFNLGSSWFPPSSNGTLWLPAPGGDGSDDGTSADYGNYWAAPYSGRLVKLVLHAGPDGGSNPDIKVRVAINVNGANIVASGTIQANNGQSAVFTAPATGWSFNVGDRMLVGLNYDSSCGCYIENTDYYVTAVWEYDVFD